jgi:biopolymer transport protein ExbD
MQFRERTRRRVIINITSLIDVLFLLLIFFMVSSTFLEQPGMKLDLPQTSGEELVQQKGYTLFITSDEALYLNEQKISLESIPEQLKRISDEIEASGLILKADEKTRYGFVVEVMDLVKQSGIRKLIIATRPKKDTM